MNIRLMKTLDALLGRLAVVLLPKPVRCSVPENIGSILLIRPGGIGDAVLLAPAIHFIKKKYPQARITILAEHRNSGLFRLVPVVDEVLCYDRPREFYQALRGRYDVVIDTEQWHRLSAVVARLTGSPISIGFATNERARLFTHQMPYSQDDYEAHSFLKLLMPLGIQSQLVDESFLTVPAESATSIAELLSDIGTIHFVTIFPGASIPERRWGTDRLRYVAEQLSGLGVKTVVVGGAEDIGAGHEIVAGGAGLNLAGRTSLSETAAVIDRSALLLSGDSGVLHIAVGLGKPTVSLFGPGRAKKWAPRGDHHVVINKELPCSPCTTFGTTPPCRIGVRCMRDITVDEVFNAITVLLTSVGTMPARCCKRDWIEIA